MTVSYFNKNIPIRTFNYKMRDKAVITDQKKKKKKDMHLYQCTLAEASFETANDQKEQILIELIYY